MSLKINKNGKEYDLGFVPQSLYDDVEDLKDAIEKSEWSELFTLNANVRYRYNSHILIVYPTGAESSLGVWGSSTLGTLPSDKFTILSNVSSNGVIDGSSHSYKRGGFLVNTSYEVKINAWEDALTGGSQSPVGCSGLIVPIKLK